MNNIEILEDLEKYISFANKSENFSNNADYKFHKKLSGMIENLIKENKKLKKQMDKDLDVIYIKGVYDERDKWKNKIKELAKKYEYAAIGYDSSEATFKQSQDIGRYDAYCNLLNKEEK